ncbi:MAG: hypothetical protein QNK37_03305 [Acidobacteriota bacterium]|nr:hypothetical protein [Acidobacteriota bacterium]
MLGARLSGQAPARALHHASELKRIAPIKAHQIQADLMTALINLDQEKHAEAEALCPAILKKAREGSPAMIVKTSVKAGSNPWFE